MRGSRHWLWLLVLVLAAGCARKPATIDVAPKKVKIFGVDRIQRLTARILDRKGQPLEKGAPTWSSSQPSVVEVDPAGRLTAKSGGKATVTVSFEKLSTQVPVEVVDVKAIEVSPATLHLIGPAGTQFPLRATVKNSKDKPISLAPTWTSSNPKIASVNAEGVVASVAAGTTTVLAKLGDLQTACEVVVDPRPVSRLEIRPATALVRVGDSQLFEVLVYGPDGRQIEGASAVFRSSNGAVASIDGAGKASGISAGTSMIQASLGGATAEATLIVN